MAGAPPACPEVYIADPETSICLPPLPPPVNTPAQQPSPQQADAAVQDARRQSSEEDPLAASADANVSINVSQGGGLKPAGGGRSGAGGWGTSNLGRPGALAGASRGGGQFKSCAECGAAAWHRDGGCLPAACCAQGASLPPTVVQST